MADDAYPPDPDEPEDPYAPKHAAGRIRAGALARKRKTRGPSTTTQYLTQEKRRKALELRKGGATYDQIATAVGYADGSGARKAIKKALGAVTQEQATELRVLQVERYNHMLLTIWPKISAGDERAIGAGLAVMDRINDLTGIRAPEQVQVDVTHTDEVLVIAGDKADYISALRKMAGIDANGHTLPALPSGHPVPVEVGGPPFSASGGGVASPDVVDAEVVEDAAVVAEGPLAVPEAAPADVAGSTRRGGFNFSVEPTVGRNSGG